jgi:hypothetical protein
MLVPTQLLTKFAPAILSSELKRLQRESEWTTLLGQD